MIIESIIVDIAVGIVMTLAVGLIVATLSADCKRRRREAEHRHDQAYALRYHRA